MIDEAASRGKIIGGKHVEFRFLMTDPSCLHNFLAIELWKLIESHEVFKANNWVSDLKGKEALKWIFRIFLDVYRKSSSSQDSLKSQFWIFPSVCLSQDSRMLFLRSNVLSLYTRKDPKYSLSSTPLCNRCVEPKRVSWERTFLFLLFLLRSTKGCASERWNETCEVK